MVVPRGDYPFQVARSCLTGRSTKEPLLPGVLVYHRESGGSGPDIETSPPVPIDLVLFLDRPATPPPMMCYRKALSDRIFCFRPVTYGN